MRCQLVVLVIPRKPLFLPHGIPPTAAWILSPHRQIELYSHLPVMRELVDMLQNQDITSFGMVMDSKNVMVSCVGTWRVDTCFCYLLFIILFYLWDWLNWSDLFVRLKPSTTSFFQDFRVAGVYCIDVNFIEARRCGKLAFFGTSKLVSFHVLS